MFGGCGQSCENDGFGGCGQFGENDGFGGWGQCGESAILVAFVNEVKVTV